MLQCNSELILFIYIFSRKDKVRPLSIIEKDKTGRFINYFTGMRERHDDIELEDASEFVCRMSSLNDDTTDVNEGRQKKHGDNLQKF